MMPATTEKPVRRLQLKQAVMAAVDQFTELFPTLADNNLMLEEAEEAEDGKHWKITLGYDAKRALAQHQKMFQSEEYRAYKTFKIDSATGKVVSMKIRTVE